MLDEIRHGLRLVRTTGPAGVRRRPDAARRCNGACSGPRSSCSRSRTWAEPGDRRPRGRGRRSLVVHRGARRDALDRRWGVGPVAIAAMLLAALGNLFIPLAPAGLPVMALACLVVAAARRRSADDGLRRDRDVSPADPRRRTASWVGSHRRSGCWPRRPSCSRRRRRTAGGGHRPPADLVPGAARRPPCRGDPVVVAGAAPAGLAAGSRGRRPRS